MRTFASISVLNFFAKTLTLIAFTRNILAILWLIEHKGMSITGLSPLLAPVGSGFLHISGIFSTA